MLILSLRNNDSTIRFGPPTWHEWEITAPPMRTLDVWARLRDRRVCFLVHGYNVKESIDVYSRMYRWVHDWYDEVVGVTWPGSRVVFGFWPARWRAATAGQMIADEMRKFSPAAIDFQGHSLGCRAILEAIRHGQHCRNAILAAAAVNDDSLAKEYASVDERVTGKVLVAHSERDFVLRRAYWLALPGQRALGLRGPRVRPANSLVVDCSSDVARHGDYKRSEIYRAAWHDLTKDN